MHRAKHQLKTRNLFHSTRSPSAHSFGVPLRVARYTRSLFAFGSLATARCSPSAHSLTMQTYRISELPLIIQEHSALVKKSKGDTIKMSSRGMELVLRYFRDSTLSIDEEDEDNSVQSFVNFCKAFKRLKIGLFSKEKYKYENNDRYISIEKGKIILDVFYIVSYNKHNPKFSFDDYNGWIFDLVKGDRHLLYTFQIEIVDVLMAENEKFFPKHKKMIAPNFFTADDVMTEMINNWGEEFDFPKNVKYLIVKEFYNKKDFKKFFLMFFNDIKKNKLTELSSKYVFTNIIFDLIYTQNFEEEFLIKVLEAYDKYNDKYSRIRLAVLHLIECINKPLKEETISRLLRIPFFEKFVVCYPYEINFEQHLENDSCLVFQLLTTRPDIFDVSDYLTFEVVKEIVQNKDLFRYYEKATKAIEMSTVLTEEEKEQLREEMLQ